MIVDWTDEFDRRLTNAEEQVGKLPAVAVALLQALNDLPAKPDEESPTSSESGRLDAVARRRLEAGHGLGGSPLQVDLTPGERSEVGRLLGMS